MTEPINIKLQMERKTSALAGDANITCHTNIKSSVNEHFVLDPGEPRPWRIPENNRRLDFIVQKIVENKPTMELLSAAFQEIIFMKITFIT